MNSNIKILLLTLSHCHVGILKQYFQVDWYNYTMPTEAFFEKVKGADLIIEIEFNDGRSIYTDLLQKTNVKKAVWLIDTHVRGADHVSYAKNFDHVFVSIDNLRHLFNVPTVHLPLCFYFSFPLKKYEPIAIKRDMGFVGHISIYPHRKDKFRKLQDGLTRRNITNDFKEGLQSEDYQEFIQMSRIGFNWSAGGECNYRVFETMAFGSLLLTDDNQECRNIPGLSERVTFYKDTDDIFSQADNLKSMSPEIRSEIICDNQDWIVSNHLLKHRFITIIKTTLGVEM